MKATLISSVTGTDTGSTGDESWRPQLHDRVRCRGAAAVEGKQHLCCVWGDHLGRPAHGVLRLRCRQPDTLYCSCLSCSPRIYDGSSLPTNMCPQLLAALDVADASLPSVKELQLPVRVLHLPVAFEDKWTKAYIQR